MKEINEEARDRYYDEVGIHLTRAGFTVLPQENGLLPLEWNGASICRITVGGGAQFRAAELEPEGASDVFHRAASIASTTAEYMRLMETAPPLQAQGLEGDYRLLADFGGAVLAGHPTSYGVEFVTWEWDYQHTGMLQGHYYGNNYAGGKQDFAVRSGLIPRAQIFEQNELDELYRCCQRTRELDDMYLRDRSDAEGKCWPGIKTIAADLKLSRSTVKRALTDLEKHGYLEKEHRFRENGSYTSNLYTVTPKTRPPP